MRSRRSTVLFAICLGAATASQAQETDLTDFGLPTAARWRFLPSAALAYDSFGQRYVVADEDTLDLLDELSGRLVAGLERVGRTHVRFKNTFGHSQEATRNDFQLWLDRRFDTVEIRLEEQVRFKTYSSQSDYTLSSDYLVNETRADAVWRPAEKWRVRFRDRFEWATFADRNRYNYDYALNDVGAELERSYGFFSVLSGGYAFGWRSVPDSSAIEYQRHVLTSAWQQDIGLHSLGLDQRFERRGYGDPSVRSDYLDYDTGLTARIGLSTPLRLRPEYRASVLRYDTPDSIYTNATEQSVELLLEGDASASTVLGIGPRAEFRRTTGGIDRPYNQWGLKGAVTFSIGTQLWLHFSDEVGVRQYLAGDETLFSDYVFNWSTLYLSYQPASRLGLDVFFSLNPENHADDTDNTTTILLSTAITYGWR